MMGEIQRLNEEFEKLNKEFEELDEDYLYEMATAWFDRQANKCAWVENPNGRNNRYFKYLNSYSYKRATKVARISLDKPEYLEHKDSKEQWFLTSEEKKELVMILNLPGQRHKQLTRWQEILLQYNYDNLQIEFQDTIDGNFEDYEYSGNYWDKGPFKLDTPIPNYLEL